MVYLERMNVSYLVGGFVAAIACAVGGHAAGAEPRRWIPAQLDADARVLGNTDEVQLLVSVAYLRVWGTPAPRPDARAAGFRYLLGVSGELGGIASKRCTLGVDCFVGRAGPTVQLEWSSGDVVRAGIKSDRSLFARVTPHIGWVAAGNGVGAFETGLSGCVGVAFPVSGEDTLGGSSSKTIVTVQALGTFERGSLVIGAALGISLR